MARRRSKKGSGGDLGVLLVVALVSVVYLPEHCQETGAETVASQAAR